MEKEAHWRDEEESKFMANWDYEFSKEVLTIKEVKTEEVQLQKLQKKTVAYFNETHLSCGTKARPMILNPTNKQFIQENTKIWHQSNWKNVKVEISVVDNPSKIGRKKKLLITKAEAPKFNLKEITDLTDYKEAKSLATKYFGIMTEEQIETVKRHLETIEK